MKDQKGVLADVTRILADLNISVDAMLQTEVDDARKEAQIVVMTHICKEADVDAACQQIMALASVTGDVVKLRVEELN